MSEYICNTEDKCGMCEVYKTAEPIVRCMDCTWFANDAMHGAWCKNFGTSLHDDYDGFCAWGARKNG